MLPGDSAQAGHCFPMLPVHGDQRICRYREEAYAIRIRHALPRKANPYFRMLSAGIP